ncbi:hypothetical protein HK104_010835 [Borealophlyctis nickersoniae]|nr:hypothetical protein HK104_010835 [Borealophlyctis nickersoniae]
MAKWGIVRLKAGEPLFGGGRGGNIDENMVMAEVMGKKGSKVAKPKGLSNLSGLSHETWKSGDGKGNRNKNRKKAQ